VTLPDSLTSVPEILDCAVATDCYLNVSVAYRILLTVPTCDYSLGWKKFLKIDVVEELFEINYVTRKVKWLGYMHRQEGYLGHYWSQYHPWWFCIKKCPKKYPLMRSNGYDGVLFFLKVIILVLEVQIYYCFSLHCSSIIIRHVKFEIDHWICFHFASKISAYIYYKILYMV